MSNYDVTFADQNRAESPLLLKLHITHLHCRKLIRKKKILKKKFLTAKKPGKQFRDVKMSRDQFFGLFKLVFFVARNGFRCFTPLLKLFQMMLV